MIWQDMVVGNHLNFNCHKFIIMQIDEFSRKVPCAPSVSDDYHA